MAKMENQKLKQLRLLLLVEKMKRKNLRHNPLIHLVKKLKMRDKIKEPEKLKRFTFRMMRVRLVLLPLSRVKLKGIITY